MPVNHYNQPTAFHTLDRKAHGTHRVAKMAFEVEQQLDVNNAEHTDTDSRKSEGLIVVCQCRSDERYP